MNRLSISGSIIGGIKETQEMVDFCFKHKIYPECQSIEAKDIDWAWDQLEKTNPDGVRFVIDIKKSLENKDFLPWRYYLIHNSWLSCHQLHNKCIYYNTSTLLQIQIHSSWLMIINTHPQFLINISCDCFEFTHLVMICLFSQKKTQATHNDTVRTKSQWKWTSYTYSHAHSFSHKLWTNSINVDTIITALKKRWSRVVYQNLR